MTDSLPTPYTQNRELSWMRFNRRILEEAENPACPLLERLRFLTIFQRNLDEYCMVRVEKLLQRQGSPTPDSKSGLTCAQQLKQVLEEMGRLCQERERAFTGLLQELEKHSISLPDIKNLSPIEMERLHRHWGSPVLGAPVPFVPALQALHASKRAEGGILLLLESGELEAIFYEPKHFPPASLWENERDSELAEDYFLHLSWRAQSGTPVVAKALFSTVRGAQCGEIVRLDLRGEDAALLLPALLHLLPLKEGQILLRNAPLNLDQLLPSLERALPQLCYGEYWPGYPAGIHPGEDILSRGLAGDLLFSYPYDSIEPFLHLLEEAGEHPAVRAISITVYRLAKHSRLAAKLMEAAQKGKTVTVLIELRARFDEQQNAAWAQRLQAAGCRVLYGPPAYKVHAKLCLITLEQGGQSRYLSYLATGNFNETTARHYTDFALLTPDMAIGAEVEQVFTELCGGLPQSARYRHLLVSPFGLGQRLLELMDGEIAAVKAGAGGEFYSSSTP